MQRPGFALALLLGSLTSSILVVGKVNSQSLTTENELPRPAHLCGDELESATFFVVLGQSVDAERNGWADRTGGDDPMASADAACDRVDWSTNVWWTLVRTGYDQARDLVLNGRPVAVTLRRDEACSENTSLVGENDGWDAGDDSYHTAGPTNLTSCEDYDHCLGDEVIEPVLLPEDCAYWLWRGIEHVPACVEDQMQDWWTVACEQAGQIRERIALAVERDEIVPVNTIAPPPAVDFQEEVLLITAADSLDHLGSRLQDAAQYLRVWAADRIVTKWTSQRVARKSAD